MLNAPAARLYFFTNFRALISFEETLAIEAIRGEARMTDDFVSSRRTLAKRSRAAVLWGLGVLVAAQILFFFPLSSWWPQLHDPQYGGRLTRLRARLAEKPKGQPFVLLLGSSHIAMGVRPGVLRGDSSAPGSGPFLFNFSMNNGCPMVSLLCLHRLLREGIKPDWLLVETCPLQLWLDGPRAQTNECLNPALVQHQDLPILSQYYSNPHKFRKDWRKGQLWPWYFHRDFLLSSLTPRWLPSPKRLNAMWDHMDEWGWQWVEGLTESYQENGLDMEKMRIWVTGMYQQFEISAVDRRAIQEIVDICRREKIQLAFLRMPEAEFFLSWYPFSMQDQVDRYLAGLSKEYQVAVIDARRWLPDVSFSDGHHLTPAGATAFTQRLDREFLQALQSDRKQVVMNAD
jgi:hypothetical protein